MLAVGAITVVALHGDDFLGDVDGVFRFAEADHVAGAGVGFRFAMGHAHAAADHHVVADDRAFLDDGDQRQIVGEHIDIVVRRQGDGDLELARQIGAAEDRLILDHTAGDLFFIQPDLVPGAGARQEMNGDFAGEVADMRVQRRLPRRDCSDHVAVDVAACRDSVQ